MKTYIVIYWNVSLGQSDFVRFDTDGVVEAMQQFIDYMNAQEIKYDTSRLEVYLAKLLK